MNNCVFCRILAGEVDSSRVLEGELVVAFLDIGPINQGHTLVVPRRHVDAFTHLTPAEVRELGLSGQRIAAALKKVLPGCEGVTLSLAEGEVAGQEVPHAHVHVIPRYTGDGLGFVLTHQWVPEGRIRWCWLQLGEVALMLQEYWRDGRQAGAPPGVLGQGVSVCLMCADALAIYRDLISRGIPATRPFVGNSLWITSVTDPDGYRLDFESPTEVPEETVYSG